MNDTTATDPNALLKLRNGASASRSAVMTTWMALRKLADAGDMGSMIALYEAREIARDPSHQPWPSSDVPLKASGILNRDGTMHDITRDVILSSVTGTERSLGLVFPVAAQDSTPGEGESR